MSVVMKPVSDETLQRLTVCELEDILPFAGVCALLNGRQVAIFRIPNEDGSDSVFALDNYDPNSDANVLSRGLVGDLNGQLIVASPIYKHHFNLRTGDCIEIPESSVRCYTTEIEAGKVVVHVPRTPAVRQPRVRTDRLRLVVIGNGMAGMRTVEELLKLAPQRYDITVFGAEPYGNYNRILLSPVLAGEKTVDEIMINTPEWYAANGIVLRAGDAVTEIDRRKRLVRSASGLEVPYDRLLLATGSNPFMLPIPGRDLDGVITFRDIQDVDAMLEAASQHRKAVVIGGGLLGLEAANGLLKQGMEVTVVHLLDSLMERQLDKPAAALLKASLEQRGLNFLMQAQTEAILGDGSVTGVRFKDGSQIPADLVVMAIGIKPNTELAQKAGLHCERGVVVNDTMQTFDPRVYAVGECVQHRKTTYGLVAPLWDQARVCATHLAEMGIGRYEGTTLSTRLKVTGIDVFSAGDFVGGEGTEDLVFRDPRRAIYKRLVLKNNRIRGVVLYGDVKDGNWYFDLMTSATDIGPFRDKLLFGQSFVSPGLGEVA
jgi:nitrite reductase (NADH) large subunit